MKRTFVAGQYHPLENGACCSAIIDKFLTENKESEQVGYNGMTYMILFHNKAFLWSHFMSLSTFLSTEILISPQCVLFLHLQQIYITKLRQFIFFYKFFFLKLIRFCFSGGQPFFLTWSLHVQLNFQ